MAKLDDIPRKTFFNTPEDYFEKLPSRIQSRVLEADAGSRRNRVVAYSLKWALPIVLAMAVVLFYRSSNPNAETILATVETEELILYLQESGMTTEELLENVEFTPDELNAIEKEIYAAPRLNAESEGPDL